MQFVRVLDPTLQLESRRVAVDQLPGFDLPNELTNALAHMAAVEGDTTKLLNSTDGALHVAGAALDSLAALLFKTPYGAAELLDYIRDALMDMTPPYTAIGLLHEIAGSLESIDTILTDVHDEVNHWLDVNYTS